MSHKALIRLGPIATVDMINSDARKDGRLLYDQMRLAPGAPVCVNHERGREVGTVTELIRMPDTPFGLWLVARCKIDNPPDWLKRGTAASFGFATLLRGEFHGWEICRRGLLNEVSVLSPGVKPAEPLAQVVLLTRDDPPRAHTPKPRTSVGDDRAKLLIRRDIGTILAVY